MVFNRTEEGLASGKIAITIIEVSMENIIIRKIEYDSKDYKKELELRNKVLRIPLGLDIYDEDLKSEIDDIHIGAFLDDNMVGTLVLVSAGKKEIRMRQVAVSPGFQGNGVGTQLVEFSEKAAISEGYEEMMLHSRQTAIGFYEKLGYEITSAAFFEVGIPHVEMKKKLI